MWRLLFVLFTILALTTATTQFCLPDGTIDSGPIEVNPCDFDFIKDDYSKMTLLDLRLLEDDLKTKAEQGDAEAQYLLGVLYRHGGSDEQRVQAVTWYRKAAEQGLPKAQDELAFIYFHGCGVPEDFAEAVKWELKAADKGDVFIQYFIAEKYFRGAGVPMNHAEAAAWYRKAAEKDLDWAQCRLGLMYYNGQGLPQNYIEAYFWANIAAAKGNQDAVSLRNTVSSLMTQAQIAKAQELSANWKPSTSSGKFEGRTRQGEGSSAQSGQHSPLYIGTGFVISRSGHVLTNYHVIKGHIKVGCNLLGEFAPLSVIQTDVSNDLALLKLNSSAPSALKFREGKPVRAGEGIVVIGYPLPTLLANQAHVTTGSVSAMAGPGNDTRIIQLSAPVQPGNSGGPLLDMAGNLVGIVTARLDAIKIAELTGGLPQNVNFAINAAAVKAFLDANGIEYESASSDRKLDAAQIGDVAKKATLQIVCWE